MSKPKTGIKITLNPEDDTASIEQRWSDEHQKEGGRVEAAKDILWELAKLSEYRPFIKTEELLPKKE